MPENSPQPEPVCYYLGRSSLHSIDPADRPKEINGQPVGYFWGETKADTYMHPVKKFTLSITPQRMDGWIGNFHKMRAAGIDVPVVADHQEKARHSLGYVMDMKREGSTLKVLHQMIGADAILMASRNKISLGINPAYIDGKANDIGDVIQHSALTPVPVVHGQQHLQAASRGHLDGDIFELAAPPERSLTMALSPDELKAIRELPGADKPFMNASGEMILLSNADEETCAHFAVGYALGAHEMVQSLSRELTEARTQLLTLSNATDPDEEGKPTANELLLMSRLAESEWREVVRSGGATPATIEKIKGIFRTNGQPNVLALSRSADHADPIEIRIAAALRENKPVPMGRATGLQALSREIPGDSSAADAAEATKALEALQKGMA